MKGFKGYILVILLVIIFTTITLTVTKILGDNSHSVTNTYEEPFYTDEEKFRMKRWVENTWLGVENYEPDLIMFDGMFYRNVNDEGYASVSDVNSNEFNKDEAIGEVTKRYREGKDFENGMATKLPVGSKKYPLIGDRPTYTEMNAKEEWDLTLDVLLVKVEDEEYIYEAVLSKLK